MKDGNDVDGDGKSDYKIAVRLEVVPVYYDVRFDFTIVEGKARRSSPPRRRQTSASPAPR